MASARDIKRKINSVSNTQKITKTKYAKDNKNYENGFCSKNA